MQKTDLPFHIHVSKPVFDETVFIAEGVQIMGNVFLGKDANIWYNSVLRGDINKISVGDRTNIQDGCILHVENDRECVVEHDVTVGHRAILHGCYIEAGCLIGMGAIILNGARIKKGSVIGAGAVVIENTIVEPYSLVVGVPAKVARQLPPETYDNNVAWAEKYVALSKLHKKG